MRGAASAAGTCNRCVAQKGSGDGVAARPPLASGGALAHVSCCKGVVCGAPASVAALAGAAAWILERRSVPERMPRVFASVYIAERRFELYIGPVA